MLLLSTCLYPPLITSWKLQELWGVAIVPALQGLGLGLDLAFPRPYSNLGVVRINTKIILAKLTHTHTHTHKKKSVLMSMIGVMKWKANLQIYTLLREVVMGTVNFRDTVE